MSIVDGFMGSDLPADQEVVIGRDNRVFISNAMAYPYETIVRVDVTYSSGATGWGTGFLTGRNDVVTAGHVVFSEDAGVATSITVTPALNYGRGPFGSATGIAYQVTDGWAANFNNNADAALITLDRNIGDAVGFMSIGSPTDAQLTGSYLNSAGYPQDYGGGNYLIGTGGYVAGLTANRITYDSSFDTGGGQSGSPVWQYFSDGTREVVGIHTLGYYAGNSGTRLTPELTSTLESWMYANDSHSAHAQGPSSDFDGDGKSDLVITTGTGAIDVGLYSGALQRSLSQLMPAGSGFRASEVADLNGDGRDDILLTGTDGSVVVEFMNGPNPLLTSQVLGPNSGYALREAADFTGDGKADLVFQNASGNAVMFVMNGNNIAGIGTVLSAGSGSVIKEAGDFTGDGKADLLVQTANGSTQMLVMDGTQIVQTSTLIGPGTGWSARETGDFNGDGFDDILWQNTDGTASIWFMKGTAPVAINTILGANSGFVAKTVADFNGDGRDDIVWQHSNGTAVLWTMNGATITSATTLLTAGSSSITNDTWL